MKRLLCAAALAALALVPFVGVGCGPKLSKVECIVTLDNQPVKGATVTFYNENDTGAVTPSGQTDDNGKCTLKTGNKDGASAGSYKVIVVKTASIKGVNEGMDPTEAMKKAAEMNKGGGPGGGPPNRPGMRPPGGAGDNMGINVKSELPAIYASTDKTPFKGITIPSDGPIELKMNSK